MSYQPSILVQFFKSPCGKCIAPVRDNLKLQQFDVSRQISQLTKVSVDLCNRSNSTTFARGNLNKTRVKSMSNYDAYGSPTRPDPNCRTCTDFKTWSKRQRELDQATSKSKIQLHKPVAESDALARDCPLDKDSLGQNTWSLLHTMAAVFPNNPTEAQRRDMLTFYDSLSRLYPCEHCAKDFQKDLRNNPVNVASQNTLAQWLCKFHNRVNRKLGKSQFDCSQVNERWRDGWKDGSCD